jgi:hypothetical protein
MTLNINKKLLIVIRVDNQNFLIGFAEMEGSESRGGSARWHVAPIPHPAATLPNIGIAKGCKETAQQRGRDAPGRAGQRPKGRAQRRTRRSRAAAGPSATDRPSLFSKREGRSWVA